MYHSNSQPVPNINVKFEVTVEANSGGHQHNVNRPKGTVTPAEGSTGPDGLGHPFTFTAPAPAGDHKIKATCIGQECTQEGPDKVWVGVKDLLNVPSSGFWELIGDTTTHPANHYLNGDALGKLMDLARLYKQVYFPFDQVLRLNDAGLERGGVFDLGTMWGPPHHEHRRGMVIDIRANGTATAIPQRNFEDFQELMGSLGMTWLRENVNITGGHYHVKLLGLAQ